MTHDSRTIVLAVCIAIVASTVFIGGVLGALHKRDRYNACVAAKIYVCVR